MSEPAHDGGDCRCTNCGNRCRKRPEPAPEQNAHGFFSRHAWIWIALGYAAFLGVMFTFIWIAQTHAQPVIAR